MKIFTAQIEYEIVVVAKDIQAAHQAAMNALTDFSFDEEPDVIVRPVHRIKMPGGKNPWMLPEGYGETELPWGGRGRWREDHRRILEGAGRKWLRN